MLILVRSEQSTQSFEVSAEQSVQELAEWCGATQLQFGGRLLRNECSLGDCGLTPFATLDVADSLLGGKKKKKKKAHTTPKKKKHVHKKVTLAVLKLYKVDKSGKVTRARKCCENCDPGTFMAKHENRNYCGKCHATLLLKK